MKVAIMGGDLLHIELLMIEDSAHKPLTYYMLKEGGLVSFMEVLNGFDESCSQQFVNSWDECTVTVNGITFQVS